MAAGNDPLLAGRIAIVTGGGNGAGAELARSLAAQGAKVCVADLNPDRAERTAEEINETGGEAFGWQLDVSNKFQVASMIEATRDRYDGLHILIHNAEVSPRDLALKIDEWAWRRTLEVNLTGAFFCTQLCARVMADEGGGVIVLLVDSDGPASVAVATTRSGLRGLGESLGQEVENSGVKVLIGERHVPHLLDEIEQLLA